MILYLLLYKHTSMHMCDAYSISTEIPLWLLCFYSRRRNTDIFHDVDYIKIWRCQCMNTKVTKCHLTTNTELLLPEDDGSYPHTTSLRTKKEKRNFMSSRLWQNYIVFSHVPMKIPVIGYWNLETLGLRSAFFGYLLITDM